MGWCGSTSPNAMRRATQALTEVFGFHPLAIRDCLQRNQVPEKIHPYADHLFVVLHASERGKGGHVHLLELDQFIGPNYLVTVHGPVNPAAPADAALRETRAVLKRMQAGRLHPRSSFELSYAIVAAVTRHQEAFVATLAREAGLLEQQVMSGEIGDTEQFLEELFRARHELLVVRTMAWQSREVYGRLAAALIRFIPVEAQPMVADLADQLERVAAWPMGKRTGSMG